MRKRISKYKHLHSNRFRYWCSSIPLVCASGLVLVLGMMVSPIGVSEKTFAASVGTATNPGGGSNDNDDTNTTAPELSMTIAGDALDAVVPVEQFDETAYRSHIVSINGSNIESYTLMITGPTNLQGGSIITGATGELGSSMNDNTWGYGWGDVGTNNDALAYQGLGENGKVVASGVASENGSVNFSKKLVFAAKFGDTAKSGHYTAQVMLSLAASPAVVTETLSDIRTMQELSGEICKNSGIEETNYLMDARDTRLYRVTKLKDGNCWMTQNLDYNDPNSTRVTDLSKWVEKNNSFRAYYDSGDAVTGNYYTFLSATNGVGNGYPYGDVPESICPSGWKIPTGDNSNSGSFGGLTTAYGISSSAIGSAALRDAPFYFIYGGFIESGDVQNLVGGCYWSSTASGGQAYFLYFGANEVVPSNVYNRYAGMNVRCLVLGS